MGGCIQDNRMNIDLVSLRVPDVKLNRPKMGLDTPLINYNYYDTFTAALSKDLKACQTFVNTVVSTGTIIDLIKTRMLLGEHPEL